MPPLMGSMCLVGYYWWYVYWVYGLRIATSAPSILRGMMRKKQHIGHASSTHFVDDFFRWASTYDFQFLLRTRIDYAIIRWNCI